MNPVNHPQRTVEVSKPRPIVVDPAFPGTDFDRVLCACLMDFAQSEPDLTEDQNIDKMLLAMQSQRCRILLSGDDQKRFDRTLKSVLPELIGDPERKPPWRMLLGSLLANQSLSRSGNAIAPGGNFEAVQKNMPEVDGRFLSLVAKAAERLRELQETAAPDEAIQTVVQEIQKQHDAALSGAGT